MMLFRRFALAVVLLVAPLLSLSACIKFGGGPRFMPVPPPPPPPPPELSPSQPISSEEYSLREPPMPRLRAIARPSVSAIFSRPRFGARPLSMGDIGLRLQNAIMRAGFSNYGYFAYRDGFALVTRLECIQPSGRPCPGEERWAIQAGPALRWSDLGSISSLLSAFSGAHRGRYRLIMFIVDQGGPLQFGPAGTPTPEPDEGSASLADRFSRTAFGTSGVVRALIYEFERPSSLDAIRLLQRSDVSAPTHLIYAGVRLNG